MLKVIELFAGIGSQTQALKNIGVEHEVVAIAEIDKFAELSYRALHNEDVNNLGDITKIEILPKADLWTYSFPCQDISVAGKQKGLAKGSKTRSGLLWEVERLLLDAKKTDKLPKYLLLENVKNLIGKKFKANYDEWIDTLKALGYTTYTQVLNAKDYGIPQNRERVFGVSILGEHLLFEFPKATPLKLCLKDMLESNVAEKYYLNDKQISILLSATFCTERMSLNYLDTKKVGVLMARDWKSPQKILLTDLPQAVKDTLSKNVRLNVLGKLYGGVWDKRYNQIRTVLTANGLCSTIDACGGGGTETKILTDFMKIRKLTPREYWRLMGWKDEQIDKVKDIGMSDTQMYKQAGNSIVVNVLEGIFKQLFKIGG